MNRSFWKRMLLIVPMMILVIMLFFIDYTVTYFKETIYDFVYDTNAASVRRFSDELDTLTAHGYSKDTYSGLYDSMIHAYSKTLGEKYAIITFLLNGEGEIHHNDIQNEAYVTKLLENPANKSAVMAVSDNRYTGELILLQEGNPQRWHYQYVTAGDTAYYIFMSVDAVRINAQINVNEIILPIGVIGLLFLLTTAYTIWLKTQTHAQ